MTASGTTTCSSSGIWNLGSTIGGAVGSGEVKRAHQQVPHQAGRRERGRSLRTIELARPVNEESTANNVRTNNERGCGQGTT